VSTKLFLLLSYSTANEPPSELRQDPSEFLICCGLLRCIEIFLPPHQARPLFEGPKEITYIAVPLITSIDFDVEVIQNPSGALFQKIAIDLHSAHDEYVINPRLFPCPCFRLSTFPRLPFYVRMLL
jgi:hypothetical protein